MSGKLLPAATVVCFLLLVGLTLVQAAPLNLNTQFQTALRYVAELEGNGTFKDCCDVSNEYYNYQRIVCSNVS